MVSVGDEAVVVASVAVCIHVDGGNTNIDLNRIKLVIMDDLED